LVVVPLAGDLRVAQGDGVSVANVCPIPTPADRVIECEFGGVVGRGPNGDCVAVGSEPEGCRLRCGRVDLGARGNRSRELRWRVHLGEDSGGGLSGWVCEDGCRASWRRGEEGSLVICHWEGRGAPERAVKPFGAKPAGQATGPGKRIA
jgi:hypothetical protein